MKLEIYLKGDSAPVSTHYIKNDIQESESGKFIQFMTINDKRIITNMDFVIIEEENQS